MLNIDQPLEFTVPAADGVMYCNGVKCYAQGALAGPHEFRVGHNTLKAAALWWYAERVRNLEASGNSFWDKEPYHASVSEADEPEAARRDVRGGGGEIDARDPEEGG